MPAVRRKPANNRVKGRTRAKPGAKGGGRFYHIEVRPSAQFAAFRVQDVGRPGGVERVAGLRASGSWDTAKWLVEKTHAHIENGRLVPDSVEAERLLKQLGSVPVWAAASAASGGLLIAPGWPGAGRYTS